MELQVWAGMLRQAQVSRPQRRTQGPHRIPLGPSLAHPEHWDPLRLSQSGWLSPRTPQPRGSGQGWSPKEAVGREATPLN